MTTSFPWSCCCGLLLAICGTAHGATPQQQRIDVAGQQREFLLVTPQSPSHAGPRPLVLLLHGHLGTAANAVGNGRSPSPLSAWLAIAEREQLVIAALQGLKGGDHRTGWHDCRRDAPENPQVDDVAFASAVVQQLVDAGRADSQRIYVMGMSNGAFMSLRLALEMRPAPAAIAAVAGAMADKTECSAATHPVSVLLIHGTADPLVPYQGGTVGLGGSGSRGSALSVEATRDFWLQADRLQNTSPVAYAFPHTGKDATRAHKLTWGPDSGPQVEVVTIDKGGHVEPSLRYHYGALYSLVVGPQNRDLEAAEEAWLFFRNKKSP